MENREVLHHTSFTLKKKEGISVQHRVLIDIDGDHIHGYKAFAADVAEQVLNILAPADPCELSVLLVDDRKIRELNRTHRRTDTPTDVLAFSQREGEELTNPPVKQSYSLIGDVVISIETAHRQAEENNEPRRKEVALLITHGILHLFGYDDGNPDEYEKMMTRSNEILEVLKPLWNRHESPRK